MTELVTGAALLRDGLHSAANELQKEVEGYLATVADATKTAEERERALWRVYDIEGDLEGSLESKFTRISLSTDPPTDTDLARDWWIEQIETAAAAQTARILGAESDQGMYSHAGCVPEEQTLRRIGAAGRKGIRGVYRAATTAAMRTVATSAIAEIQAHTTTGAGPAWYEHGASPALNLAPATTKAFVHSPTATGAQAVITVDATPGSDSPSESECAITGIEILQPGFAVARSVPTATSKQHRAVVTYEGDAAPKTGAAVRLTARNHCGPSVLTISVG